MIRNLCRLFGIAAALNVSIASANDGSSSPEVRKGQFPAVWSGMIDPDNLIPTLASAVAKYEIAVGGPCQRRFGIAADMAQPATDGLSQSLRQRVGADSVSKLNAFLDGCGRTEFEGLAFNFNNDDKVQIALFGPAQSLADYQLEKDVAAAMYVNVNTVIADRENCSAAKEQPMVFFDREVADVTRIRDEYPAWTERWAVPLCGKMLTFKIDFQINDAGAAYSIKEDGISDPQLFSESQQLA